MNQLGSWFRNNHVLLMAIGCVLPLGILAAIFVFNLPLGTVGLFAIVLLCPLMHLLMMRGMGHGDHGQASCDETARDRQR